MLWVEFLMNNLEELMRHEKIHNRDADITSRTANELT